MISKKAWPDWIRPDLPLSAEITLQQQANPGGPV
jgi:hypothetical protein